MLTAALAYRILDAESQRDTGLISIAHLMGICLDIWVMTCVCWRHSVIVIDEVVNQRLTIKVATMADALNDTSLNVEAIPYDIDFSVDDMNGDDIQAVLDYFFGDGSI